MKNFDVKHTLYATYRIYLIGAHQESILPLLRLQRLTGRSFSPLPVLLCFFENIYQVSTVINKQGHASYRISYRL